MQPRLAAVDRDLAFPTKPLQGKHPLDIKVAEKLLDLLSVDNRFRRLFKNDPFAALIEVGYTFEINKIKNSNREVQFLPPLNCLLVEKLASKKEIAKSRAKILEFLTGSGNHHVIFAFESGKTQTFISKASERKYI